MSGIFRLAAKTLSFLWVIAATACADSGPDSSFVGVVRDSVGVRLVSNSGPDTLIPVHESLRVGGIEGDPNLQFDRIRTLAIDSLGGFWVSDSHESVRHYDPAGRYLGQVGSRGEGPDQSPRGYGGVWVGRGAVLARAFWRTMQLFSEDGTFLGSRSLYPGGLIPLGPNGEEWNLRTSRFPTTDSEPFRERWTIGRASVTGTDFDTLFAVSGHWMVRAGPNELSLASFFYGPPDIRGDGEGNVYYSHSLDYRIEVYGKAGELIQVVSREVPSTSYPPSLREEVEEGVREALHDPEMGIPFNPNDVARITEKALPVSTPEHLPFLESLLVSADGFIWAQRGDRHPRPAMRAVAAAFGWIRASWLKEWRAPSYFDLFSPDGLYRGSVVLPEDFDPLAVTRDRIFGSVRDDRGVQRVVAYSLGEGGSS